MSVIRQCLHADPAVVSIFHNKNLAIHHNEKKLLRVTQRSYWTGHGVSLLKGTESYIYAGLVSHLVVS